MGERVIYDFFTKQVPWTAPRKKGDKNDLNFLPPGGCVARRGRRSRSNEKCLVGFVSFACLWKNVENGWIPVSAPKKFHLCKLCVPLLCCSFDCVACFHLSLRLLRSSCSERSCCGPVVLIFRSSAEAGSVQLFVPSVKLYSGVYFMFFYSFVAFYFFVSPFPTLVKFMKRKKKIHDFH